MAFQKTAEATFYQSFLWCRTWCDTVGKSHGVQVRIVTGTDQNDRTVFILPLQIRRRFGIRVLECLGAPNTTYGHGLFAPEFLPRAGEWFSSHWPAIVKMAGPLDAVHLANLPEVLNGQRHPLGKLFSLRGPNRCYRMALASDYEALLAKKRSKATRRYYRKKERGMEALGSLTFGPPATREETHAILETMFEQQEKRLGERGVHGVFSTVERDFIHRMADLQDEANPVVLPYALKFDGAVMAVLLGCVHANTFWAMISSLAETDLRKYSPGDLALRRTIEASCKNGLSTFDFAAGDTAYKLHWTDHVTQLHVILKAVRPRGFPWAFTMAVATVAKRLLKQSPALRATAMLLRKTLLGRPVRHARPQD